MYNTNVDAKKLILFSNYLNLDCKAALDFAMTCLKVDANCVGDYYITFDKEMRIGNFSVADFVNFITYGNLSVKGYKIVLEVFQYVQSNIEEIYSE